MRDFFRDRHLVSNPYLNFLEVFSLLLLLWIVMSEIFQVKFVLYGCISAFLISCFVIDSLRIGGLKSDRTYFILHANYLKLLIYFLWLIKEVVKSAVDVTGIILTSNDKIDPLVVWFKADYDNPAARAILAKSPSIYMTVAFFLYTHSTESLPTDCFRVICRRGLPNSTVRRSITVSSMWWLIRIIQLRKLSS